MPTAKYFDQCPKFPADVPIANVPTISFKALKSIDNDESERLFEACKEYGFFLLDLRGSSDGEGLLKDGERMFDIRTATMNLGENTLNQYAYKPPTDLFGYKRTGKLKTDDGKLDAIEMYNISQDDMLSNGNPRQNPEPLELQRTECREFFHHAHAAIRLIFSHLDKQLGLAEGTLASLTPLDKPSERSLRLLLAHPQNNADERRISLGGHTDIGVITLLFNVAGGLQILPAGSENVHSNWRYIRPQPGCAVVNLGDTIVEWTGGLLRSSLHRVVTAPGKQAEAPRQSVAYLVRPARNGSMRRLKGRNVIPPLEEGEEDESRSVDEWAASRALQVIRGELKPQTRGGRSVRMSVATV
ncbi:MAG: hypothetical protein M1821_002530 [Bathelium mastoideum]|nr:MAG: hypothetical protein M1821_002530 [Bathelium mastoideum]